MASSDTSAQARRHHGRELRRARSGRASTRSDGHQARRRGRRAPAWACSQAPAGGRLERRRPRGEQRADDAAQHVAGAGGGQAGVAVDDDAHLAVGRGDDGRRALEQHDRAGARRPGRGPRRGGRRRAGAPASRSNSPSWGVSTVGRRRGATSTSAASAPRAVSPSPSTTAGTVGAGQHVEDAPTGWWRRCRARARSRGRWNRSAASSAASAQPAAGRLEADRLGGSGGVVGHARASPAAPSRRRPAGRRRRPGGRRRSCRRSRRRPARRPPTCGRSAGRGGSQPRDVGGLHDRRARRRRRRGRCRRPRPRRRSERPGSSTSPGLSAAKVTVRTAGSARPCSSPVSPSMPLGMSTASTGAPAGSGAWCSPRKPGAVGGVDDEVGRRQRGRGGAGVDHLDPHAAAPQPARPRPDRRRRCCPCRPARPPAGRRRRRAGRAAWSGHRRAGPLDEHLDRLGRGGVDRGHLVRA